MSSLAPKEETPGRKTSLSRPPDPQPLNCPRCDSPNTKFCYFNNYNLTQPRHFCKTCRRYWTKGGALRNVPIGGGCRKTKKIRSSSSSSSRLSCGESTDQIGTGLKFFHGGTLSPAMDFQLGHGSSSSLSLIPNNKIQYPSSTNGIYTQFSSFNDATNSINIDPAVGGSSFMGFNFPIKQQEESSGLNIHSNLASSIESLSYINQDLHWKLQQQRLSMIFNNNDFTENHQPQKLLQPILFQNLEISRKDDATGSGGGGGGDIATEWFFDSSATATVNNPGSNVAANDDNTQTWAWNELHHQYTSADLP